MKRFNTVEWIGFILIAGLALYLTYLLREGAIVSFIHPKRIPLMWAAGIGLLILAAYQSTKIFTIPSRKANINNYIPLGFVLVCATFTLSAKETDRFSADQSQKNIGITSNSKQDLEMIEPAEDIVVDRTLNEEVFTPEYIGDEMQQQQEFNGLGGDNTTPEKIEDKAPTQPNEVILNDENYSKILSDIEINPGLYTGKKMIAEGFVYRNAEFADDEFVIARMYMTCCAADAQIMGLLCRGSRSVTIPNEQWVRVEGILKIENYKVEGQESVMPIITISEVKLLPTPENQYIYAY